MNKRRIRASRLTKSSSQWGRRTKVKRNSSVGVKLTRRSTRKSKSLTGYKKGYQEGYMAGLNQAGSKSQSNEGSGSYQEGYKNGYYDGGDAIVDRLIPWPMILPDITIRDVIMAGIEQMKPHFLPLLESHEVFSMLQQAVETSSPFSLVRLGDGELLTLSQELVLGIEQVREAGSFLPYAGVQVPDLETRDQLIHSIQKATVVGIPKVRLPYFQPLFFASLRALQMDYRPLRLTFSTINYSLYLDGYLMAILSGKKVIVIGSKANELKYVLRENGIHVVHSISPVYGTKDVDRVMSEVYQHSFDIAFVSAGIAAVLISERIATEMGKIAIDLGHLSDAIIKGEAPL